jgi:hypothetical protein
MELGVRGYAIDSGGEPACELSNESDIGGVCAGISQSSRPTSVRCSSD